MNDRTRNDLERLLKHIEDTSINKSIFIDDLYSLLTSFTDETISDAAEYVLARARKGRKNDDQWLSRWTKDTVKSCSWKGINESKFIEELLRFADAYRMTILDDNVHGRGKVIISDKFKYDKGVLHPFIF